MLFVSSTWGRADQQTPGTQTSPGRFVLRARTISRRASPHSSMGKLSHIHLYNRPSDASSPFIVDTVSLHWVPANGAAGGSSRADKTFRPRIAKGARYRVRAPAAI